MLLMCNMILTKTEFVSIREIRGRRFYLDSDIGHEEIDGGLWSLGYLSLSPANLSTALRVRGARRKRKE
jgi:hypothetical protein